MPPAHISELKFCADASLRWFRSIDSHIWSVGYFDHHDNNPFIIIKEVYNNNAWRRLLRGATEAGGWWAGAADGRAGGEGRFVFK
jgi:hypothetical protein